MKKNLLKNGLLILISLLTISFSIPALAEYKFETDSGVNDLANKAELNTTEKNPEVYIGRILLIVFSLIGVAFVLLTMYAGIAWMTAQGNTSQVSKAKDTLVKSIVGFVIIMAAYGITFLVVKTFQQPDAPTNTNLTDSPIEPVNPDPYEAPIT